MSVYDRDYMKPGAKMRRFRLRVPKPSATLALSVILPAVFIAQNVAASSGESDFIRNNLCFSGQALKSGKLWVLITSAFLHGGIGHILVNLVGLWCFGRGVEREYGAARFLRVFLGGSLAGTVVSAFIWLLPASLVSPHALVYRDAVASLGASCGVMALTGYYFADKMREEFTALLYFVIPVQLSGRIFVGVLAGISVFGLLFTEIPLATGWWRVAIADTSVSHSGHLGGLLFGYFIGCARARRKAGPATESETGIRPEFLKNRAPEPTQDLRRVAREPNDAIRGEIDRILDKINTLGLGSLTEGERAILKNARETLTR